jgi:hypothetical protein
VSVAQYLGILKRMSASHCLVHFRSPSKKALSGNCHIVWPNFPQRMSDFGENVLKNIWILIFAKIQFKLLELILMYNLKSILKINLNLFTNFDFPLESKQVNVHPIAAIHSQFIPTPANLRTSAQRANVQVGENPKKIFVIKNVYLI